MQMAGAEPAREGGRLSPERNDKAETDEALVWRARKGDLQSFEQLYRRHSGRIYALCLRLSGNAAVAEDCTQDTFIRAWEKLESFRGESAFGSWVYRIATNTVFGMHRSNARKAKYLKPVDDEILANVADRETDKDAGIDLENAIAELPEGARQVFVLHDIEGMLHEEIARMTGLAVGTSKAQLHRARKLLRERLQL